MYDVRSLGCPTTIFISLEYHFAKEVGESASMTKSKSTTLISHRL